MANIEDLRKKPTEKETPKEKVIEPVAKGKKKSRGFLAKVKDSFIAEETTNFGEYILTELVVPTVKDAICDGVANALSMLFYGEPADYRHRSRRDRDRYGRRDYAGAYSSRRRDRDRDRDRDDDRRARHSAYDFELIECETKSEAMDILDHMDNILEEYDSVSIADMYDLAGISRSPEDNNYGWTNLAQAKIERTRDGLYVINMPRAKCIK